MQVVYSTKDITTPKAGLEVYKDSYWICEGGNPKKALFYGNSPQCNRNKAIMKRSLKLHSSLPEMKIVFIETAFVASRE